jgi:hypothetical protein
VRQARPEWQLAWMPSVLFLSGFPQLNWGYHILSDNLGVATGFAVSCYAAWLVTKAGQSIDWGAGRWALHLALLFFSSVLAFLARETGWFAVITLFFLVLIRRDEWRTNWLKFGLIFLAIVLGKIPHSLYGHYYALWGVPLKSSLGVLFNPEYMLDLAVKTAVCFNVAWLVAALGLFQKGREPVPDFILAWSIAAVLYLGAGYYNNWIGGTGIGFPMRTAYPLFPLVFFGVAAFFERYVPPGKRLPLAIGYCLFQYGMSYLGVTLDSAKGKITTMDVWNTLRGLFP